MFIPKLKLESFLVTENEEISLKNCAAWTVTNYGTSEAHFLNHFLDPPTSTKSDKQTSFPSPFNGGIINDVLPIYFKPVNSTDTNVLNKVVVTVYKVVGFIDPSTFNSNN